ncbi:MAG: PAS domain S-box protein [Caldilineaceae bacterium]
MPEAINQFLQLPTFADQEVNRIVKLLSTILWFGFGATLLAGFMIPFVKVVPITVKIIVALSWLVYMLSVLFLYQKRIYLAGLVLVVGLWLLLTYAMLTTGGVRSPAFDAYLIAILVMGLIFGLRASLVGIGLALLAGSVALLLERYGLLPVNFSQLNLYGVWGGQTLIFLYAATLVHLAIRDLSNSLSTTQLHERALAKSNQELRTIRATLEQKIAERTADLAQTNQRLQDEIDQHEQTELALSARVKELEAVALAGAAISMVRDTDILLQRVVDMVQEKFAIDHMQIYLLNQQENSLLLSAAFGEAGKRLRESSWEISLNPPHALAAQVAQTRTGTILHVADQTTYISPNPLLASIETELAVPIIVGDKLLGVFDLQSSTPKRFTTEDLRLYTILAGLVGVALQHVYQYQQTEAILKEYDQQRGMLQTVLDNMPAGVWVVEASSAKPLLANNYALQIFGGRLETALAPESLATAYNAYCYDTNDLYPTAKMPITRGLLGEATMVDDMEIRYEDGSHMLLQVYGAPIRDAAGRVTASVAIFQDITERKQAETALRESEEQYRRLVETMNDGLVILDKNSRITYINDKYGQMFGYERDELLGIKVTDILDATNQEILRSELRKRKNGVGTPYELAITHKQGHLVSTMIAPQPLFEKNGDFKGSFAVLTDITELLQAKRAAEAANQAKSNFLANVSHELRTPLNGILGYAQILQRDSTLTDRQRRAIRTMEQSGEHLLTLLNDILDLSKIEANRMELNLSEFDFLSFLHAIAEPFRIRAQQKHVQFLLKLAADLPTIIRGDEIRLRQILINLLSNAVKFTTQGSITLEVSPLHEKIRFQVQDTGVGIEVSHRERIFEPFQQLPMHKGITEGTGLGLPISQRLAKMMGATIKVASQSGQGSTFWLDIALPQVVKMIKEEHLLSPTITAVKGDYRILIVDDEAPNRTVLEDALAPLGFHLQAVTDGAEALALAVTFQPHLILMDIRMPVMDGLAATRAIRQSPSLQNVIILAISAGAFPDNQQECLEAGCNGFIAKPFHLDELLQQLQLFLNLEWRYADPERPLDAVAQALCGVGIAAPPREELAKLRELTLAGDVGQLNRQLMELEQRDELYKPFVAQLHPLLRRYQTEAILTLIKQCVERAHTTCNS